MKDAYYFPHDYNAIQDPKMMILLSKCGLAGIGMYWVIIEILHQQKNGNITEEEFKKYIEFYCHFQTQGQQLLNTIEQVLINDSKLLSNNKGIITSTRVLRNKKHREEISEKRSFAGRKSAEIRLKTTSVQQNSTNVNNRKERKGKEIKGKEIKDKGFEFLKDEVFKGVFRDYLVMRQKIRKPATSRAQELALIELHKYDIKTAIAMLEQSIMNSWQGIFPLRNLNNLTKAQQVGVQSMQKLNERLKKEGYQDEKG